MPTLTLQLIPNQITLGLLPNAQLCYLLLTITAGGGGGNRPVNWALIADASRSMRIPSLNLGEQTDLAHGIELGLNELRRGRATQPDGGRADRLLLLTDGFTQRPEECLRLASIGAAEGVAITTIGLGGEFQEDVLT